MKIFHPFIKKSYVVLFLLFFFCFSSEALACWGTRPLAMGGAFTGLADDTNAIYWNPGGLGLQHGTSTTHMSNLGDNNNSNYDHYLAFATEISGKERSKKSYGTIALAFVSNETVIAEDNGYREEYVRRNRKRQGLAFTDEPFIDRDVYAQIGYGIKLLKKRELAVGISFKMAKSEIDDPIDNRDTKWMDLDLGAILRFGPKMGKSRIFSVGFLFQNIGEAKLIETDDAQTPDMVRNLRPGFSIKPDEETILSVELYDTLGETRDTDNDVSQNIRIGAERWITNFWALRAGVYHINNSAMRAYTGGIGIKLPEFWNIHSELDFTLMHWDKTGNNTGFGGLTLSF